MIRIAKTDPQTYLNGVYVLDTSGVNKNEQLMLYNDSPCGCHLDFEDKSQGIIPAYWNKDFIIEQPMGKVIVTVDYTLINPAQYPISLLYGELYEKEERVASVNASINRGIVVTGGAVTTTQGQTLINEGNAPGSVVERFSSSANVNDTTTVTNDGLYTLYVTIASALVQFLKSNNTDPILQLGAAAHLVEILGNLTVDGTLTGTLTGNADSATNATNATNANVLNGTANLPGGKLGRTAAGDVLDATTAADTYLKANTTVHEQIGGVDKLNVNTGGPQLPAGTAYQYLSGKAARQQGGHATGISGIVVTHGLGNTPAFVLVCTDIAQPGSATIGAGSVGATTFTSTCGAGTGFWWYCLAGS